VGPLIWNPHIYLSRYSVRDAALARRSCDLDVPEQRQVRAPTPTRCPGRDYKHDRERRLELLIRRLPRRVRDPVRWLRQPKARWLRLPAGLLLIVGGVFSILPILGLWMLPLGLVLLAEDLPPVRRGTDSILAWIERRRPHWMGLPDAASPPPRAS
jgi:hypothetical protein